MSLSKISNRLTTCLMSGLLFLSPFSVFAEETAQTDADKVNSATVLESSGVEGTASYYAKRYHNRRTNSGSRYSHSGLTAAHPTLPHGSKVKVINLSNNKEVIVTINDRCRPKQRPFIDLSREAARRLGFLGKGVAQVRIILLKEKANPENSSENTVTTIGAPP